MSPAWEDEHVHSHSLHLRKQKHTQNTEEFNLGALDIELMPSMTFLTLKPTIWSRPAD